MRLREICNDKLNIEKINNVIDILHKNEKLTNKNHIFIKSSIYKITNGKYLFKCTTSKKLITVLINKLLNVFGLKTISSCIRSDKKVSREFTVISLIDYEKYNININNYIPEIINF